MVLQRLSPAERVAFVLHDIFGVPFGSINPVMRGGFRMLGIRQFLLLTLDDR